MTDRTEDNRRLDVVSTPIESAIDALLQQILDYQKRWSKTRSDTPPFSWNRGTSGNLPILRESTVQQRLVELLRETLGAEYQVVPEHRLPGNTGDLDVGVIRDGTLLVPLEIKSFPPVATQTKEINNTRNDARKLALASRGLCYYVVATSFVGDRYNWNPFGHDLLTQEMKKHGAQGRCVVCRLEAELASRPIPNVWAARIIHETLQF
jgi:hypothetical protein